MTDPRADAVKALLDQTEAAHGAYESTELNGEYDQDWPRWYATYAVANGLGRAIGRDVGADRVAGFLAATFAEFEAADPKPVERWSAYMARRMVEDL